MHVVNGQTREVIQLAILEVLGFGVLSLISCSDSLADGTTSYKTKVNSRVVFSNPRRQ